MRINATDNAIYQAARYWQRRARGACVRCGVKIAHAKSAHCPRCQAWRRHYAMARTGKHWTAADRSANCRRISQIRWAKWRATPRVTMPKPQPQPQPQPKAKLRMVTMPLAPPAPTLQLQTIHEPRDGRYQGRPVVTIYQACIRAGVSRRTIYNWIAAKKIGVVRTAGGAVRILEDTLWR